MLQTVPGHTVGTQQKLHAHRQARVEMSDALFFLGVLFAVGALEKVGALAIHRL